MSSTSSPRHSRTPREILPLQVQPLMAAWVDGDLVRATLRRVGEMSVIALGGPLDATAEEPCRRALDAVLHSRPRRVVVDLASVTSSTEACVGLLSEIRRRAAWHGVDLWLAGVPEHVRLLLAQSGVLPHFQAERSPERVADIIRLRQTPLRHRTA